MGGGQEKSSVAACGGSPFDEIRRLPSQQSALRRSSGPAELADTVSNIKTTVDIPDALLAEARAAARERNATLRELVAEGLRMVLARSPAPAGTLDLPTFGGDGVQPGVDLETVATSREAMYPAPPEWSR